MQAIDDLRSLLDLLPDVDPGGGVSRWNPRMEAIHLLRRIENGLCIVTEERALYRHEAGVWREKLNELAERRESDESR